VVVMFVVYMGMLVLQHFVGMLVQMTFAQVEPHPYDHEYSPDQKERRGTVAQPEYGNGRSEEWSDREVGAGPRSAQVAERKHKEDQA
jgi:hypothetical protein